jgi:hypothetical protein
MYYFCLLSVSRTNKKANTVVVAKRLRMALESNGSGDGTNEMIPWTELCYFPMRGLSPNVFKALIRFVVGVSRISVLSHKLMNVLACHQRKGLSQLSG